MPVVFRWLLTVHNLSTLQIWSPGLRQTVHTGDLGRLFFKDSLLGPKQFIGVLLGLLLTNRTSVTRVPHPGTLCPSPRSPGGVWAESWPDLYFSCSKGFLDWHRTWGTTLSSSEDSGAVDGNCHPEQPAIMLQNGSHLWGSFYSPCCGHPHPADGIPAWGRPMDIVHLLRTYGSSLHHKNCSKWLFGSHSGSFLNGWHWIN